MTSFWGRIFWHRSLLHPLYTPPHPIVASPPCEYSWPSNNTRLGAPTLCSVENPFNFWLPRNLVVPQYPHRGLFQEPSQIPKSTDAEVPCRKSWRMRRVGSPHLQTPSYRSKTVQIFTGKKKIHIYVDLQIFNPCCARVNWTTYIN